jgi:HEPN domain-containing protein
MTNAAALAADYIRRAHMRVRAVEALIDVGDFADAVRESQESVELAIKAVLKLKDLTYPRAHDVARLLRDPRIVGPLLTAEELARIERISKSLRRDRELSFYGDADVVPLEYYERSDADAALAYLREVLVLVSQAFARNGTPAPT